jgi:branched-chain amino acid transport system substrate-binding protein
MVNYVKAISSKMILILSVSAVVIIAIGIITYYFYIAKPAGEVKEVNIAVFMPLSGEQSVYGHDILQAIQYAAEEINSQGGIRCLGGAKINLIVVDITSDASKAVSIVEDTLTRYKISAAVGPGLSYLMIAVQPIFIKYKIPAVTGAISVDILKKNPKGEPWVFMMGPTSEIFGGTSAKFLDEVRKRYNLSIKIAIVHGSTEYEVRTADAAYSRFKDLGFDIVLKEQYSTPLTDATPIVQKIGASGANFVYPVSYLTDAILIIKTMKALGVKAIVIGGGAGYLYPSFYEALKEKVAYVISVAQWNYDFWPKEKIEEYKRKFNVLFPQEQVGVNYAGVYTLKEAIEKACSTDPVKIAEALRKIKIDSGPAGPPMYYGVEFDETGWNKRAVAVMVEWTADGRLVTIYPFDLAKMSFELPK